MKLKWIVLVAVIAVVFLMVVMPRIAPTVTTQSLLRDGQVATGDTLVMMNQSDLALTFYNNVLAGNASDAVVLKKKGEALIKCGRVSEASQMYQRVLSTNCNDTQAMTRMGDTRVGQGDLAGGLTYYNSVLAQEPTNTKVLMKKGDVYLLMSMQETQQLHSTAKNLGKQPGSPGYQEADASQLQSTSSYQKAMEAYQKAMEIDPKLSIAVSTKTLAATQAQVANYQTLLNDLSSS